MVRLSPEDEIVSAIQGGKIEFELSLVDENGRPVSTAAYDQYRVGISIDSSTTLEISQVANANGSVMTKVGSAECGIFNVLINPADSATLGTGDRQDIDFEMSEQADPTNVIRETFPDRLEIRSTSLT